MEETLERLAERKPGVPKPVKTLALLAYIGNGLWALLFLGGFFWFMVNGDRAAEIMELEEIPLSAISVFIIILELIFILCILGAYSMAGGRRAGFWLYLVANSAWILLNILPGQIENFCVALISIGFVIGFASQVRKLD